MACSVSIFLKQRRRYGKPLVKRSLTNALLFTAACWIFGAAPVLAQYYSEPRRFPASAGDSDRRYPLNQQTAPATAPTNAPAPSASGGQFGGNTAPRGAYTPPAAYTPPNQQSSARYPLPTSPTTGNPAAYRPAVASPAPPATQFPNQTTSFAPTPAPPTATAPSAATTPSPAQQQGASQLFSPARIIARVGDETILAGDLLGTINQMLAPYEGKAPPEEIAAQRELLMQQMLSGAIETKLVYNDFLRGMPAERIPDIEKALRDAFIESRLDELIERAKVANAAELDEVLRGYGSSLEKSQRVFKEQVLAQQHLKGQVKADREITHIEMLQYYRDHTEEFAIKAEVRWERLMARYDRYPSRDEAFRAIAGMGNEVVGGAQFAAVAKKWSQGASAESGGYHDWTHKGSLASTEIDEAIFSLPVGKLSQIIADKQGYHIIRVIERNDADTISFVDAQPKIKEKLLEETREKNRQEYLDSLRANTYIWTVFDK